jgi:hypothetical protein
MVITHLIVDTRDAMGANVVNTMAEALAPEIESWTGGRVYLRILSNLADRRLARARAVWPLAEIGTEEAGGRAVAEGIISAYHFAAADPYRAATHNKGIMNGVSAVVLATGNDTRAIEAGAHAYAARGSHYTCLSRWEVTAEGDLAGSLELPLAVGVVGGATKLHPTARLCLEILGVKSAEALQRVIVAVGLAQNFAALKALRRGRPGPELRGAQGPGDRGRPARPHGPARPEHRHDGRRARRGGGPGRPGHGGPGHGAPRRRRSGIGAPAGRRGLTATGHGWCPMNRAELSRWRLGFQLHRNDARKMAALGGGLAA